MTEARAVSLKCPNCGAGIEIGPTVDTFACGHCGASVQVERGGNIIALKLLQEAMTAIQRGTDRTAAELAIQRIGAEIAALKREQDGFRDARNLIARKWAAACGPINRVGSLLAIAVAIVIAPLLIIKTIVANLFPYAPGLVALAIICFLAWFWTRNSRRARARKAAAEKLRDQELAEHDERERLVRQQLDEKAVKLKEQQRIADA